MNRSLKTRETGLGWGVVASALFHAAFYGFLAFYHLTPSPLKEAPVYYVDVVNLPVANPRAGSPTVEGGAPSQPAPVMQKSPEMSIPAKRPQVKMQKKMNPGPASNTETSKEFEERIAKLQRTAEANRQEAAFEALRKKLAGSGKTPDAAGMPGGTGSEAGSDYASYIQSRLKDAFKYTIAYQSKAPEVVLKLTIDGNGHVVRQRMERSSGDRIFEDAVVKAIVRAEKTFPRPPAGGEFEVGFIFRPQGVGKK